MQVATSTNALRAEHPPLANDFLGNAEWLIPSVALTLASGVLGISLIPDTSGIMPAINMVPLWMLVAVWLGSLYGLYAMKVAGVERPIARVGLFLSRDWRTPAFLVLALLLAGINMTTFMWVKPLLNYLVPFWADPLLADIDFVLFLGNDPWSLLDWLNTRAAAIFYHRGWFALMILTLVVVLSAPPSVEKSALMLTYFLLWSVVGPLVHALLPAAGPIFFEQIGHGDRFSRLEGVEETRQVATYLWRIYADRGFGPGSGISAMPSLHLATTAWMLTATYVLARRWLAPMAICAVLIFLLSISLGWHYAVDGLVGGGCAVACYMLARKFYRSGTAASRMRAAAR